MRTLASLLLLVSLASSLHAQAAPPTSPEDVKALAEGYLPKEDLGVPPFRAEHPEGDGRGIVVAVLDTGVDLLHPGLQRTSLGLPKIVDVYDATDAGLVETTTVVEVVDGQVEGLTGRTLTLGKNGGEGDAVRLGRIRADGFLPPRLVQRLLEDRRKERDAARRVEAERTYGDEAESDGEKTEILSPVYDVVVFPFEDRFACAVDVDEDGDLAEETTLIDYRDSLAIARFPDELHFGMAANLADDGTSVSFFFDGGGHGTHVGGIIGAYYGEEHPLNGLAPGAQIIGIKIGNTRHGGSTTHMSMIKALDYAAKRGAHIANASFGGGSFWQNGREETVRFAEQLIDETGILCTFSAGNNGPALSTVGSPALGERIFSIGATVSAKTQVTNYGVLDPTRTQLFGFSSRGPLFSGSVGVDFLAPGVAMSTVPTWFLANADSWNGTSMAAPQAAGMLALLLSAAEQHELEWSYRKVRLALERSSKRLDHLLHVEQGYGLLQLPAAFEELSMLSQAPEPVLWKIGVDNEGGRGAGLYDRHVAQVEPFRKRFRVEPQFSEETTNEEKASYTRILKLEGAPTWARVAPLLHVAAWGENVDVEIDPRLLAVGLNTAEIRAVDWKTGAEAFRLSLVLVKAREVDAPDYAASWEWNMAPGDRRSEWFRVPVGATRAKVTVTELDAPENTYRVVLSQATPWSGTKESGRRLTLERDEPQSRTLRVEGGATLEVVTYSRWHTNGEGRIRVEVEFAGLEVAEPHLVLPPRSGGAPWKVFAPLGDVDANVTAELEWTAEPFAIDWEVTRDPWYAEVGEEGTMFLARGAATVRAMKKGERIVLDLNVGDEFDDFLDDAFWRLRDPGGKVVASGFLYDGRIDTKAPARGDFELEATVVAYGKDFVSTGMHRIIAPERLRPLGKNIKLSLHPDVYVGIPNREATARLRLDAGERGNHYLRLPEVKVEARYRGTLTVKDDEGQLFRGSIEHDHVAPATGKALRQAAIAQWKQDLDQATWLGDRDAAVAARDALAELGAAPSDLDHAEIDAETGGAEVLETVRGELETLAAAEAEKDKPSAGRLGRIHGLRALVLLKLDRHKPAAEAARHALEQKPTERLKLLCQVLDRMIGAEGTEPEKAVEAARKLVELRPYDRLATDLHIEACYAAGYAEEAAQAKSQIPDRFPAK